MENLFEQLVEVNEQVKQLELELENRKAEYNASIMLEKAALQDLQDKEDKLREEALLQLEKDDMQSTSVADKTIVRSVKYTPQITDNKRLYESMLDNRAKLLEVGVDASSLVEDLFQMTLEVKDKKKALEVANNYTHLTGETLDGIDVKETKFITIKKN